MVTAGNAVFSTATTFPGLAINTTRLAIYVLWCVLLLPVYVLTVPYLPNPGQADTLALAFLLGAVVPVCIVFRKQMDLLEPLYWFSVMYFVFFPGAVYFLLTDFQHSQHNLIADSTLRDRILIKALWLALIGYVMFLVGYLTATLQARRARIQFGGERTPDWLILATAAALLSIGMLNFVYLIVNYPGGLVAYYSQMGIRLHRLDAYGDGVTTLGLQFVYAAVWMGFFVVLRRADKGQYPSRLAVLGLAMLAAASAAILASQGRLFQTVSYCLAMGGMLYAFSDHSRRNVVMLLSGAGLLLAGIALYFGRLVSVLLYNRPDIFQQLELGQAIEVFVLTLNRSLLDSGNVTDLTSFMNVLAYWEQDFSFLYGSSFASAFGRVIPGIDAKSVAETTQAAWSTGAGALPPTFTGELYANFGSMGVIGGMLVAGFFAGRIYRFCVKNGGFLMTLLLCAFTFRFFFILPKGETVNLTGMIWTLLPVTAAMTAVRLFYVAARRAT